MVVCWIIPGGFFLAIGIYLWFWLDRRHFNRRNIYGPGEVFKSYKDMRKIRIIEFFLKGISVLFIFFGIDFILMGILGAIFT